MTDRQSPESGSLLVRLSQLSRSRKRVLMLAADLVAIPLALWCAFALRFSVPDPAVSHVWWLFPVAIVSTVPVFARLGLYRAVIRFMGSPYFRP